MYPPVNPQVPFIWHGGDYNPEQWPCEVWNEDMRLMQESHYDVATVGVFSWVTLQPEEDRFTFEWLDEILDKQFRALGGASPPETPPNTGAKPSANQGACRHRRRPSRAVRNSTINATASAIAWSIKV